MSKRIYLIILLVIFACISTQSLGYTHTDDTFIDEWAPGINKGTEDYLIVRSMYLTDFELDTLLKFDLSYVPAGTTVKSATLGLYYWHYNNGDPYNRQLDVYHITEAWDEGTVTWNNQPSYDSNVIDSAYVPGSYGWMTWDVTSSVQEFVDGTKTNYGWQIMDVNTSGDSMIYFRSKEYADSGFHPSLQLDLDIIFIDENATGANNGSSWADAYTKLQDALSIAVQGDRIWVAAGTYKPDQGGGQTPGNRTATFQLINSAALYGGFAGGETSLEQRDWENNVTILSGDINTPDVNSDNSYHVVTGSGTNPTAVLDGFTITGANADGSASNSDGGGMYNYEGSPTVSNCTFTDNTVQDDGGGMYNDYHSDPIVVNCTFSENRADDSGGGMTNDDISNPTLVNCIFRNNDANGSGGGGIYNGEASSPILINCAFSNNHATSRGGGIYNRGETANDSAPTLINCTLSANSAGSWGGGMYTSNDYEEDDPNVVNCIFWGNTDSGGSDESAQIDGDTPVVTYSCIQDSNADDASIPFGGAANNNIDDDPLFAVAGSDNLRLSGDSPCIETGSNSAVPADTADLDNDGNTSEPTPLHLDNRSRFADGDCDRTATVDMGAYELIWVYIGDLDGDCDVDFMDFAIFSANWLAGK